MASRLLSWIRIILVAQHVFVLFLALATVASFLLHWPVREDMSAWPVCEDMSALLAMVQHLPSWTVAPAPLRGLAALVLTEASVFPLGVTD